MNYNATSSERNNAIGVAGSKDGLSVLITELSKLPGIGAKSAERLAFHILRMPEKERTHLARIIHSVKDLRLCQNCFNITGNTICSICADERRDHSVVCVVEESDDLAQLEKTGAYNGVYHILLGHIAPLDNKGPEDITIRQLVNRLKKDNVAEVIIATNPTVEGDNTALYIQQQINLELGDRAGGIKLTRLARGIPSGSTIEYANMAILTDALKDRRELITGA